MACTHMTHCPCCMRLLPKRLAGRRRFRRATVASAPTFAQTLLSRPVCPRDAHIFLSLAASAV